MATFETLGRVLMSGGGCYRDVAATGLAIRPLSLADLPRVLEIERLAYSHPWSEGVFQDCFKDSYRCWALSEELGLVGYAIVNYLVDEAHLLNLCVAPDKRRLGGGRCLLRHVLARARAEGMVQVLLEVRESNDAAYRLYRQEGFREIGRRKGYYPAASGREDARVMALSLDSCSLPGACPL